MVSVIVPVYNVLKYLERCLTSLDNQTEKDIEIIVVNDGSTDGSDKYVQDFIKGKNKFKYVSKENGGLMSAWMEGVKHVSGDYIGFIDSDDYAELDMFEKLYSKAKQYNADIVMSKSVYDDVKDGKIISKQEQNNGILEGFYEGENLEKIRLNMLPKSGSNYISPSRCNKIIKKEVLLQNLKYCDTFVANIEDVNSMVPCFFSAKSFYYLNEGKYHYVKNVTSLSYTYKATLKEQCVRLINKLTLAKNDYNVVVTGDRWEQMINSYGVLVMRMILKSNLKTKEKNKALNELFNEQLFLNAVKNTIVSNANKWEKAYIKSMLNKNVLPFKTLLFLLKIKNLIRKFI
ncbi:MAG: glycosyltransferase family 2 protein [Clostridia bacterium]|nr:glycosyltransferase family 2 protein [Clostridia bacterium]